MEPFDKKYERKRLSILYTAPALMYAGTILATLLFWGVSMLAAPELTSNEEGLMWLQSAAQFAIGMPLCAVCMSMVPADPMEKFRPAPSVLLKAFLAACFFMVFGSLVSWLVGKIPGIPAGAEVADTLAGISLPCQIICIVILGPLWEEIIFRKMMLDRINRLGDRNAMIISAFAFAAYHGNLQQFFYAFGAGLVFAYIYLRTGKLRYTAVMHMLINLLFGVLPASLLPAAGTFSAVSLFVAVLEYGAALAGFILLIMNVRKIRLLRGWIRMPSGFPGIAVLNAGVPVMAVCCIGLMILAN